MHASAIDATEVALHNPRMAWVVRNAGVSVPTAAAGPAASAALATAATAAAGASTAAAAVAAAAAGVPPGRSPLRVFTAGPAVTFEDDRMGGATVYGSSHSLPAPRGAGVAGDAGSDEALEDVDMGGGGVLDQAAAASAAGGGTLSQSDRAALAALPADELVQRAVVAAGQERADRVADAGHNLEELLAQAAAMSTAASAATFDGTVAPLLLQLRQPKNPAYQDNTCPACGEVKYTKVGMVYHLEKRVCLTRTTKLREDLLRLEYACPLCSRAFATLDDVTTHCAHLPCQPSAGREQRARIISQPVEHAEGEEGPEEEAVEDADDCDVFDAVGPATSAMGAAAARRATAAAPSASSQATGASNGVASGGGAPHVETTPASNRAKKASGD